MPSNQSHMQVNQNVRTEFDLPENIRVVSLTSDDFIEAKSVLCAAYRDDPLYRYIFDDSDPLFDQRIRSTVREGLNLHLRDNLPGYGVKYKNRLVAVAFIRGPGKNKDFDLSKEYRWHLGMYLTAGFGATRRFLRYRQEVRKLLPSKSHNLVAMMAVHPEYQNTGLGIHLLNHLHMQTQRHPDARGFCVDASVIAANRLEDLHDYLCVDSFQLGGHTRKILYRESTPGVH